MAMTPQYIALRKLLHTICSTLSKTPDSISPLANDLNGEGLIPDAVSSAVQQTAGIAPYNLASKLVSAVHIAIKLNTDKFYVFAQKLDEHEFPELSKKLLEKCVELGGKGLEKPTVDQPVVEAVVDQETPLVKPQEEIGSKLHHPTREESTQDMLPQGESKIRFDGLFKKKHMYDIARKPDHGIALIINNRDWVGKPNRTRSGSEHDVEAFKDVVDHFKYTVTVRENLTAEQMKAAVEDAGKAATPNHDSFICCIMSHGDNEGIEGVDGSVVTVEELALLVGPKKCPNLVGKPKIFILQACRGQKIPQAIQFDTTNEPEETPSEPELSDENEIQFDSKVMAIPPDADYFYAYCTTPTTMSMRRPSQGTFYIQILCEKLQKKASKMSLHDIVLRVHDKLATDDGYAYTHPRTGEVYRQMGQVVSTLRKKVYFS